MNYLAIELTKIHKHYYTKSSKKQNKKKSHIVFFPMPPKKSTKFLEPIGSLDDTLKENEKLLYSILEKKQYDNNYTFNQFLDKLHLTKTNYIIVIQNKLIAKSMRPCILVLYGVKVMV